MSIEIRPQKYLSIFLLTFGKKCNSSLTFSAHQINSFLEASRVLMSHHIKSILDPAALQHQPRGKAGSVHPKYQITVGPGLIKTVLFSGSGLCPKSFPSWEQCLPKEDLSSENAVRTTPILSNRSCIEPRHMLHRGFLFTDFICLVFWIQLRCLLEIKSDKHRTGAPTCYAAH